MSGRRGLIRGARPGARKLALFVAILASVAATAIFVFGMVKGAGEADKYGGIRLPGKGTLDLPEGTVALYYEERVTLNENESLDIPSGLRVVARRENDVVRSEKVVHNAVNTDGRSLREFAKLEIPRAGRYKVTARSSGQGSNRPGVTFGKSQLDGLGRLALVAGGIEVGGLLLALGALLAGRRGYEGERSSFPVPRSERSSPGASPGSGPGSASGRPPVPGTQPAASAVSAAPVAAAPMPAVAKTGDPLELQLRELERRHEAGSLSDEDYAAARRQVLDSAFKR